MKELGTAMYHALRKLKHVRFHHAVHDLLLVLSNYRSYIQLFLRLKWDKILKPIKLM